MSQQSVVLKLPDELYERIHQIALDSQRPVEEVVVSSLALMFGELPSDEFLTPQQLAALSDEQLWAIVYRPLTLPLDLRLRELATLSKLGALSPDEQSELERLIAASDRYVLLRSHALLLLKQRGHAVEQRLKLGA